MANMAIYIVEFWVSASEDCGVIYEEKCALLVPECELEFILSSVDVETVTLAN